MIFHTDSLKKLLWNLPKRKTGSDILAGKLIVYGDKIIYFCGDNFWVSPLQPFVTGEIADVAVDCQLLSGLLHTYSCDLVVSVFKETMQIQRSLLGEVPQVEKGVSLPCTTRIDMPSFIFNDQEIVDEITLDVIGITTKNGYIYYHCSETEQFVLEAKGKSCLFQQKVTSRLTSLCNNDVHISVFETLVKLQEGSHTVSVCEPCDTFTVLKVDGHYDLTVFIRQSDSTIFSDTDKNKTNPATVVATMEAIVDDDRLWVEVSEEFSQLLSRWKLLTKNSKIDEITILLQKDAITFSSAMKQWSDKVDVNCKNLLGIFDVPDYCFTVKTSMLELYSFEHHRRIGFTPTNDGYINMMLLDGMYTVAFSTVD